jgi:hypothetical protein
MANKEKLRTLADSEGMDVEALLRAASVDSVCPGICMTGGCDYTIEVEPDCQKGWCEVCAKGTVSSALILAGLI